MGLQNLVVRILILDRHRRRVSSGLSCSPALTRRGSSFLPSPLHHTSPSSRASPASAAFSTYPSDKPFPHPRLRSLALLVCPNLVGLPSRDWISTGGEFSTAFLAALHLLDVDRAFLSLHRTSPSSRSPPASVALSTCPSGKPSTYPRLRSSALLVCRNLVGL